MALRNFARSDDIVISTANSTISTGIFHKLVASCAFDSYSGNIIKSTGTGCAQANQLRLLLLGFGFVIHGRFSPMIMCIQSLSGLGALPWHLYLSLVGHGRGRLLRISEFFVEKP